MIINNVIQRDYLKYGNHNLKNQRILIVLARDISMKDLVIEYSSNYKNEFQ